MTGEKMTEYMCRSSFKNKADLICLPYDPWASGSLARAQIHTKINAYNKVREQRAGK